MSAEKTLRSGNSNKDVKLKIVYLADHKEYLQEVAEWYYSEWGHLLKDPKNNEYVNRLEGCLNKISFPLVVLAINDGELIGAAQIKLQQMPIYPEKEHWLAGVYVKPEYRGQNISNTLLTELDNIAINLGVKILHLQTERLDGGLYSKCGWQSEEIVNHRNIDVMVMSKVLIA